MGTESTAPEYTSPTPSHLENVNGRRMDENTTNQQRDRLPSEKGYGATLAELLNTTTTGAETWIDSANKPIVASLLKAALQELRKLPSLATQISVLQREISSLSTYTNTISQIQMELKNIRADVHTEIVNTVRQEVKETLASVVPSEPRDQTEAPVSSQPRGLDELHHYQVKIIGLPETEEKDPVKRSLADKARIEETLEKLSVTEASLTDCYRQGQFDKTKRTRPLIARFSSVWDTRRILLAAHQQKFYTQNKILIIKDLSQAERQSEKVLLKKRYELMQQGIAKDKLKIRNLKLYNDNQLVKLD